MSKETTTPMHDPPQFGDAQGYDPERATAEISSHYDARGLQMLRERYTRRGESPADAMWRVSQCVARGDEMLAISYMHELLTVNRFLPNTPTWTGAGVGKGQLAACFVLPIGDTMESIFGTLKDAALIQSTGGGTGFNFGHLRPKGAVVKSSQGRSSGPISFIRADDASFGAVQQGGYVRSSILIHIFTQDQTRGEHGDTPDITPGHSRIHRLQASRGKDNEL
jgi:ribonucleotide reductase alpha subunit